jgi:excisionase family DNA binding protein
MAAFLTTRQLQDLLQVDRTTIYRMAEAGRLPGVKVGKQWRFARDQIEAWLAKQSSGPQTNGTPRTETASPLDWRQVMPLECMQRIQDSFAELLGAMMVVTDGDGQPLTQPSHPCGLYLAIAGNPVLYPHCLKAWAEIARDPTLSPRFYPTFLGLLCTRGLIRIGDSIQAMLVVGGIAPPTWPPSPDEIARVAVTLAVEPSLLERHLDEVHHLQPQEQARVLAYVQRIADVFAHIINERLMLFERLQRIAEMTKI